MCLQLTLMATQRLVSISLALFLLLTICSCSHPSKIAMSVDFGTRPPDLTVITVRVKNQEMRPTTPLAIDVSLQLKNGAVWGQASSVLHPAAFVLNKQEEQILRATVKLRGETIRATVTVKEQQTGKLIASEHFEKVVSKSSRALPYLTGESSSLSTLVLGTRLRPDK